MHMLAHVSMSATSKRGKNANHTVYQTGASQVKKWYKIAQLVAMLLFVSPIRTYTQDIAAIFLSLLYIIDKNVESLLFPLPGTPVLFCLSGVS